MIFIVEGPDGSGKSTLIQKIRQDKQYQHHFLASSSQPKTSKDIINENDWINEFPHDLTLIIDRHRAISEPIYGKILRGWSLIDPNEFPFRHDVRFIYCRPPVSAILNNILKNPQLKGVTEKIYHIIEAYDQYFNDLHNSYHYDYTVTSVGDVIDWIHQ